MILSATLSKPAGNVETVLGKPVEKIKIKIENSSNGTAWFAEMFTKTQVFHQHLTEKELTDFLNTHSGTTFKNCVQRTESEEITILANKKGKITRLVKKIAAEKSSAKNDDKASILKVLPPARKKNYLLEEGKPVPFLVLLGIMNSEGKVINSRYDKFRQINRFLEFIDDVLPSIQSQKKADEPLLIADFGCGKSYLTFAVHYFLTEIRQIPCEIEGLDLKEDVIKYCNDMVQKLGLKALHFKTGDIASYSAEKAPDLVITLHACDTATDFALKYAVSKGAKAILSVPCCQHQINQQLNKAENIPEAFESLTKWGIIQEKFSSLVTDALRGQWLESKGYRVQMLEFIDMEHTPKNLLIRAVKRADGDCVSKDKKIPAIIDDLGIMPEIWKD